MAPWGRIDRRVIPCYPGHFFFIPICAGKSVIEIGDHGALLIPELDEGYINKNMKKTQRKSLDFMVGTTVPQFRFKMVASTN